MDSTKGTKRKTAPGSTSKTPDTEVDKTIDEESGSDVERARLNSPASRRVSFEAWRDGVDTWMSKSDAWREKTDDKLKALTDVLLETRDLVRSLTRHPDTYQAPHAELDGRAQARAAREEASASKSLDTGDPEEIKEDDDDDDDDDEVGDEGESKFSKSRKELKKLLKRSNGLNDSDADEEDDDEEDGEDRPSPVLTPTSTLGKGKRQNGDDTIPARGSALKKIKSERRGSKITPSSCQGMAGASSDQGPVKEEEIRAVLLQRSPLTTFELVDTFKARLKSPEDKKAFAEIMKRITKIQKTSNNQNYVVLRK